MDVQQAFGEVLRDLRSSRKLSQEALAEKCGLHRTYISFLERGLRSPTLATIILIGDTLNLPAHQIVLMVEDKLASHNPDHSSPK